MIDNHANGHMPSHQIRSQPCIAMLYKFINLEDHECVSFTVFVPVCLLPSVRNRSYKVL